MLPKTLVEADVARNLAKLFRVFEEAARTYIRCNGDPPEGTWGAEIGKDEVRLDWLAEHYWEMRLCFNQGGDIREAIDVEMAKEG